MLLCVMMDARIRRRARRAGLDLSLSDDDVWPQSLHCKYFVTAEAMLHYTNKFIIRIHI